MRDDEDRELIRRFQDGQESAFNELVRAYQERVYQTIRRLVDSHEEAQDLSQEVFLKVYRGLRDFRGEAGLFTWIYRIAVNLSLNALRRRRLRRFFSLDAAGLNLSHPPPGAESRLEHQETMETIARAIERLPRQQKAVFTLRYFQQLPHGEIARILKRDVSTIKANYHQAIRKLRKAVQS